MRQSSGFGIIVVLGAILLAGGAAFYLTKTKEKIEKIVVPVEVAAPDLFPKDTLFLVAMHRIDESYSKFEEIEKRLRPTALWHSISGMLEGDRSQLPPPLAESIGDIEKAMDDAEARFGHRPTSRDFFEIYGKHTSFAIVPGKDDTHAFLAIVRVPDGGAVAMIQANMEKTSAVKRHTPGDVGGYPVFFEERDGAGKVFYGMGGGFFFVSNTFEALSGSLQRLAALRPNESAAAAAKVQASASLASDPVLKSGAPGKWEDQRFVIYAKRDQNLAKIEPQLAMVDEALANAFKLAEGKDAVAFSLEEIGNTGEMKVRSSFPFDDGGTLTWLDALPEGMTQVILTGGITGEKLRATFTPKIDAFEKKAIWGELDALLTDTDRLEKLLAGAIPAPSMPPRDVLERLPADARFIAWLWRSMTERALFAPPPEFLFASKIYPPKASADKGEGMMTQQIVAGMRIDPFYLFFIAGILDTLAKRAEEFPGDPTLETAKASELGPWIKRVDRDGFLVWQLNVDRLLSMMNATGDPEIASMLEMQLGAIGPVVMVGKGRLFLINGHDLMNEVIDLSSGKSKASFAASPLYKEITTGVPEGAMAIQFAEPGKYTALQIESAIKVIELASASDPDFAGEYSQFVDASIATLRDVSQWTMRTRATFTATYPDRPMVSIALADPEAEKLYPGVMLPAAPLQTLSFLPDSTFGLLSMRMDFEPALARLRQTFLDNLADGEAFWDDLMTTEVGVNNPFKMIHDDLLTNLSGEFGMAIALPSPPDGGAPLNDPNGMIQHLPAVIGFAEMERPDDAFNAIKTFLEQIDQEANGGVPFKEALAAFQQGEQPVAPPMGTEIFVGNLSSRPVAAIDVYTLTGENYVVVSICFVQRGNIIFGTHSVGAWQKLAAIEPGGEGSLASRIASDAGAEALPTDTPWLALLRSDGILETLDVYVDAFAPALPQLSLAASTTPPTDEQMQEHMAGWQRAIDLFEDLFRARSWMIWSERRTGDRIESVSATHAIKGE